MRGILTRVSFLQSLKMGELDALLNEMEKRPFKRGETIINQGDTGDLFYIVASGKLNVYKSGFLSKKLINTMGPRTYFGEMALLENAKRSATIIGEMDGELYTLSRDTFNQVLLKNPHIAELIKQAATTHHNRDRAREQ